MNKLIAHLCLVLIIYHFMFILMLATAILYLDFRSLVCTVILFHLVVFSFSRNLEKC